MGQPALNVLVGRYRDAYMVANVVVGLGNTIKTLAMVAAAVAIFLAIFVGGSIGGALGGGIAIAFACIGTLASAVIYILGVLIAAQGQIHYAILDVAVNSSPLLINEQKAWLVGAATTTATTQTATDIGNTATAAQANGGVPPSASQVPPDAATPTKSVSPRAPWQSPFCYDCGADIPVGISKCPSCGKEL